MNLRAALRGLTIEEQRDYLLGLVQDIYLTSKPLYKELHDQFGFTPQEYDLFARMLMSPGKLIVHDLLIGAIQPNGESEWPHSVLRLAICRVRDKIKDTPMEIIGYYGQGYALEGAEEYLGLKTPASGNGAPTQPGAGDDLKINLSITIEESES